MAPLVSHNRIAPRRGKVRRGLRRLGARIRRAPVVVKARSGLRKLGRKLRLPPKVKKAIKYKLCVARGFCTLAADRVERALPGRLGRGFHKARLLSPGHLSAFAAKKFKQDPRFLAGFSVAFPLSMHAAVPVGISLGLNPVAALVLHEVLEPPLALGILAWRQHHLRTDRSQTFRGTLRSLGTDYKAFAKVERKKSRRFMAQRARAKSSLRQLGRGLAVATP